ncbi:hypothetical protein Dsin_017174 [Dipteronia sinensis]|uniref:RNase H type-1 domain-containing protein n=1 Tax=Dipteronia sinensis TaxID=43782 RepID=A0AAE0E7M5_9ROSI|nr:hypothetical protein Dsin_017174 [Dipteronia sinensis]
MGYDASCLEIGCMGNSVEDLLILRSFGIRGRLAKASVIKSMFWLPPAPSWVKINTDGAALSSSGIEGYMEVFGNCRSFVKGFFAISLGQVFAFEAELLVASIEISSHSESVPLCVWQAWKKCIYQNFNIVFQVSYILREGNQVAVTLSKHAIGLEVDSWWFSAPPFCSSLVGNDCMSWESVHFS